MFESESHDKTPSLRRFEAVGASRLSVHHPPRQQVSSELDEDELDDACVLISILSSSQIQQTASRNMNVFLRSPSEKQSFYRVFVLHTHSTLTAVNDLNVWEENCLTDLHVRCKRIKTCLSRLIRAASRGRYIDTQHSVMLSHAQREFVSTVIIFTK